MNPLAPYMVWIKLGVLAALIAVIGWKIHAYGNSRYATGANDVLAVWDQQKAKDAEAARKLQAEANRVSTKIVTQYRDRVRVVREKADVIERQVPVYIPAGLPLLPGGFRLLHDAAAANEPVAGGAAADDAAPTDPQAVAATFAVNYGTYHKVAAELISLQDWVYAQCLKNPPPEGCTKPYD